MKTGLYFHALHAQGTHVVTPSLSHQVAITNTIEHVMGGSHSVADVHALQQICTELQGQGAEAIILGCTELPLVLQQEHVALPLYDAVSISAKAVLAFSQ